MNLSLHQNHRLSAPGDVWRTERRLPEIWRQLIEAGFETGHAYGKHCVWRKPAWVAPGAATALRQRRPRRGTGKPLQRHPYAAKMKFGVSGCTRECSEAQGKAWVSSPPKKAGTCMFAVTAAETASCGSAGSGYRSRNADQILDRFMMFYIRTADKLTRTARG